MPNIDITRQHDRPLADAKKSIDRVAEHIAKKFAVACEWDGNTLNFSRPGVSGHIKVTAKQVHVTASLGFLLMALQGPVEREINRYLDEEFG
ncbi:MAG TPA: polyhydroxyalkanoic acid system family protein [Arenimonas sp.]|uniref:polyhydroxyalkanoic acid system family protein n=1 Tax=Arenimonas sp. TaxID=1872635 RepID=UPI002CD57CE9|nr:polyhydroxyalkanoic acid system family protein [Arenimonas sp.]HMB57435.1 polyhydroxyalkanoic acid system family protein [Arenimonas sp.]